MRSIIDGNGKGNHGNHSISSSAKLGEPCLYFVPHCEENYQQLVEVLGRLIDLVGEDESFLLASMMEAVSVLVAKYEEEYVPELEEDTVA